MHFKNRIDSRTMSGSHLLFTGGPHLVRLKVPGKNCVTQNPCAPWMSRQAGNGSIPKGVCQGVAHGMLCGQEVGGLALGEVTGAFKDGNESHDDEEAKNDKARNARQNEAWLPARERSELSL